MLDNLITAASARQASLLNDARRKADIIKELEKQIREKMADAITIGRCSCYLLFEACYFDAEEQFQAFAEEIEPQLRDRGYVVRYYRTETATSAWVDWHTI